MLYDPRLLDRLEELGSQPWVGVVYRHMFGNYQPIRYNTEGARWNPRETAAIYASLDRETTLAEAEYRISLEPFRPKAKRTIYQISVRLSSVVDLSGRSLLADMGITDEELGGLDLSACQTLGGAVAWMGNDGLLVPSARADGTNLVIYPSDDYDFDVVGSEVIAQP